MIGISLKLLIVDNRWLIFSLILYVLGFLMELAIPRGYIEWGVYFLPVLLSFPLKSSQVFLLSSIGTALIVVGHYVSPGELIFFGVFNRVVGIIVFWLAAISFKQRKRAEEKIRYLASFPNQNPNPILEVTCSGKINYANPAVGRILKDLGMDEKDPSPFVPAKLKEIVNTLCEENERVIELEISVMHRVFITAIRVLPQTATARIYAVDITSRKQAESQREAALKALRQSQSDMMRAQEVGQIGSWRLDVNKNELTWSDETHRIFGVSKGTPMTYEAFLAGVHPDDRKYVDTKWKAGLAGEPYDIDHRIIVNGKIKWVREKAFLEFDETGRVIGGFGITQDITERKRAEEVLRRDKEAFERMVDERSRELIETQKDLDRARRLSDIGQLASTVAHELRNPLAAIHMATSNIERKITGSEREPHLKRHVENISKKLTESERIIDDLLFYTRLKAPHWEKINIGALINECVDVARARHPDHAVDVQKKTDAFQNLIIDGDPLQLKEVFANIINNAFDALENKTGTVMISADIKIAGLVLIKISDTGKGIPPENLKKIFDPFFSTKTGGTGLGLAVCRQIVELHNGEIDVESQAGQGTTLTITLPIRNKGDGHF